MGVLTKEGESGFDLHINSCLLFLPIGFVFTSRTKFYLIRYCQAFGMFARSLEIGPTVPLLYCLICLFCTYDFLIKWLIL